MKRSILTLGLACQIFSAIAGPAPGPPIDTLMLGKISDEPQTDLRGMRPLVDWVASQMGDVGITRGDIILAKDGREMAALIKAGKVDWVAETIGMGTVLSRETGAEILLERWKHGERGYRSVVFVRSDTPVASLEDLRGRTVAFEHPGSTTGFMIPALEMFRRGISVYLMNSPTEKPAHDAVGYFFSGDEINTSTWVFRGSVDGGALADTDWKRYYQVPASFQDDFKVIFRSDPLPRAVELFRKGLDPAVRDRIIAILTTAHESERGRDLMRGFQETTRFRLYDPADWPYAAGLTPELSRMLEAN